MKKQKQNKKIIYCISIMEDFGELWLDENKKPLDFVHTNDARFNKSYHEFIINYFGGKLIETSIQIDDDDLVEKLYEECGDAEELTKLLKKEIDKL